MSVELWATKRANPASNLAARFEGVGWDGLVFMDTQNLDGDVYVSLALAASTTTRIKLGTGVTNPLTRHPAVTACAIASIQAVSNGRATLGIGRGDSALAHLGLRPAPVSTLRSYLVDLQTYLRGEPVPMERAAAGLGNVIDGRLPLADTPADSRLQWLADVPPQPKVAVFVAASGPKVIRLAAEHGDRVMLAVGAHPDRVRWGIETARSVRGDVPVGAYVNVIVDDDADRALRLAGGRLASFTRFSAMHGTATGPVSAAERVVMEGVVQAYQMTQHGRTGTQVSPLTPAFAERFAILGPASYCVDRLLELAGLGIDRFQIIGPPRGGTEARRRFVTQVLPRLRDQL